LDFYISATSSANQFYENLGDSVFIDIAPLTGLDSYAFSKAAIWADFDNDGWDDIYIGNHLAPHLLFKNLGDGSFMELTDSSNIVTQTNPNSINVVDINNDGFLDIYLSNVAQPNELFINQGDFTFTEESEIYGLLDSQVAMGTIFFDYDFDQDLDCYLTHDADQPALFYENNGDGSFVEKASEMGLDVERNGMGVDIADYDFDGDFDIYLSNLYPNDLLENNNDGTFTNVTDSAGVGDWGMGWGMFFFDYDNDTDKDIFINNMSYMGGFVNVLYRNDGDGTFTSVLEEGEALESLMGGYGAAYTDVNRDGYLDIILANISGSDVNQIFINENSGNNWVTLELEGTISNKNAINSQIFVYTDSLMQMDELLGGSGYCSQNMVGEHFGLGQRTLIDSVRIEWPSGLIETYDSLEVNNTYQIIEGDGIYFYDDQFILEEEEPETPDSIIVVDPLVYEYNNPGSGFNQAPNENLELDSFSEEEEEEIDSHISELETLKLSAFPNPSSQVISWNLPFNNPFTLTIYDLQGKVVYSEDHESKPSVSILLSELNSTSSQFVYEFETSIELISGRFFVIR